MDVLNAMCSELLFQNNITENDQKILKNISVPQHHSKKIGEMLLYYPSRREQLIKVATSRKITEVEVAVRSATGKTKPFWEFVGTKAILVLNEH